MTTLPAKVKRGITPKWKKMVLSEIILDFPLASTRPGV